MVNGLDIVGWGIEVEGVMLNQPISMPVPEVIGVKLTGKLPALCTATDLVLCLTAKLREKGVVEKFVEFYGPGVASLSIADRATVSNMAPEYGATIGFFPMDKAAIDYLHLTGRSEHQIAYTESYLKAQGLFRDYLDSKQSLFRHYGIGHGHPGACFGRTQTTPRLCSAQRHEKRFFKMHFIKSWIQRLWHSQGKD